MGLPLPGETILVLAAIYAATEPSFNVGVVIAVAAFGAIVGDNAGYWLGLRYGYALLLRYGERIGMFEARIKLGQYLFLKHGAKVVCASRSAKDINRRIEYTCRCCGLVIPGPKTSFHLWDSDRAASRLPSSSQNLRRRPRLGPAGMPAM